MAAVALTAHNMSAATAAMTTLDAVVIGANILIWSEEPRPEVRSTEAPAIAERKKAN
jgi:hypothetical protein